MAHFGAVSADHTLGLALEPGVDGLVIRKYRALRGPAAQTAYLAAAGGGRLLAYHHMRLHHRKPVVTFGDRLMFARGRHDHNDSDLGLHRRDMQPGTAHAPLRRFGIDAEALHHALGAAGDGPAQVPAP